MNQHLAPLVPPERTVDVASAPPSYDEAIANAASGPRDQNISNSVQVTDAYQEENERNKRDQKKESPPLATAPPPIVTIQPQPQPQTTYSFVQPVIQQPPPSCDCCMCCIWMDGEQISDLCYCIFCCSRHVTGHDAGCCDCGEACCSCPDGCCDCGDCDCGDCDCGDCDCDCGDCDCGGCDCGDCTIL